MIKIGLTGSIGMGKSETAKIFLALDIPVFDSDQVVHDLMGERGEAVEAVSDLFEGVRVDDHIDRQKLARYVIGHPEQLKQLESILHPMVQARRENFYQQADFMEHDIVLLDIPLLFETGSEAECDYIIVVSAPFHIQKQRVLQRPNMTEDKFNEIIKRQLPDQQKRDRADFIIETDQGIEYAKAQVSEILSYIRSVEQDKLLDKK